MTAFLKPKTFCKYEKELPSNLKVKLSIFAKLIIEIKNETSNTKFQNRKIICR